LWLEKTAHRKQDADFFEDITECIFTGIPEQPDYCSCLKHINKLKEEISGELWLYRGSISNKQG